MHPPKAALFDLDDTLAESFQPPHKETIDRLVKLLAYLPLAILTGRDFPWMERDFLPHIACSPHADRFYVFPEAGAQGLRFEHGAWIELYREVLSEDERRHIRTAVLEAVEETGALQDLPVYGEQFVYKGGSVAFSALGRQLPPELRYAWDPGNMRRSTLRNAIAEKLPAYDVLMGGATTIDVNKKGINKAHAVHWLSRHLNIEPHEMLYVGDALFPGGNDYVVIATGAQTKQTSSIAQTQQIIDSLLNACA